MVADLCARPRCTWSSLRARPVGLFSGGWQESLKNRDTRTMTEFAAAEVSAEPDGGVELAHPRPAAGPRALGARRCRPSGARAAAAAPGLAAGAALAALRRSASASTRTAFDLSATFPNESMGVAEAETLRRINLHLKDEDFTRPFDRGVYIRTFLADERLATRDGEKYWPTEEILDRVPAPRGRTRSPTSRRRGTT